MTTEIAWRNRVVGHADMAPGALVPTRATGRHRNTSVSGDTRVDWPDAFAHVPSLTVGYV